jgi:hypothetical protein
LNTVPKLELVTHVISPTISNARLNPKLKTGDPIFSLPFLTA